MTRATIVWAGVVSACMAAGVPGTTQAGPCTVARQLVAEQCGCLNDWSGRGAYRQCVRRAASRLREDQAPAACKLELARCAARSTCGDAKAVTCVVEGRCLVVPGADVCFERGGMASEARSCCDLADL
jgi:hypothetical protein